MFDYPENIYRAIFGAKEHPNMPMDAEETLERVLGTLTPREADILTLIYKDKMTYVEIGEKYNWKKQRVPQVISKSIRRLRHPSRSEILSIGQEAYLKRIVAANEEEKTRYHRRIRELEALIRKQVRDIETSRGKMTDLGRRIQTPQVHSLNASIECLNLSVRASNCLYRAGIRTIKNIDDYGDLKKIRNMGEVSVREVEEKMTAFLTTARRKYDHLWLFDTTAG